MPDNSHIPVNLAAVRQAIVDTCQGCGRSAEEVTLLAVSKRHPERSLRAAYEAGQRHFGENYAQEFAAKLDALHNDMSEAEFHYIGYLQSNKARLVAGRATLIHTVDRPRILRYIDRHAQEAGVIQPVLFEVHLSPEDSKAGCTPEQLQDLLEEGLMLPGIEPRGLMTMPPWDLEPEEARPYFSQLRKLRDELSARFKLPTFSQLSMGMSHDFQVAIEEGATIVRVGTSIFGQRIK
jgi:PLP dependent protein